MNYLKILGISGSKTKELGTTSFQISKSILVDAGNIISILGDKVLEVEHLFITHPHFDHISDLPFIIETYFEKRNKSLIIYASKETIQAIKDHVFNNIIWPDFSKINLTHTDKKSIIFKTIEANETIIIDNYSITAFKANHVNGSFGFIIDKKDSNSYMISGDTYENDLIWDILNNNPKIKSLIIECSFPSRMETLAFRSKHLTPKLLNNQMKRLKRDDINVFIYHIKSLYYKEMEEEIKNYGILRNKGKILKENDIVYVSKGIVQNNSSISNNKFEKIIDINLALSYELDKNILFEKILNFSRNIINCEAGTLYIMSEDKKSLEFKIIQNTKLNYMTRIEDKITWSNLPLYLNNGKENKEMVAVVSALENKIINIPDVYNSLDYKFEGTKKFDAKTGYKSVSMLVIPLVNHEKDVIGVLQLINKMRNIDGIDNIVEFTSSDEKILKSLANQAAMALTNSLLINSLEDLINSFVSSIARAIDKKSKHTRNHISNVSKIALLIAKEINEDTTIYKNIKYDEDEFKEIELAAWLHDIGKISVPENVINKATKLEKIVDRIELVKLKYEIIRKELEISLLKKEISENIYKENINRIEEDLNFLKKINLGSEYVEDKAVQKIKDISKKTYSLNGKNTPLLTNDEIKNLSVRKGTLTDEEKDIMNSHAKLSLDMLSNLPFPKKYSKVINIAVNHHEKLNGQGYPRGLTKKDLNLEDRIMGLADIFEALTSKDRPYKHGKKLSEVFKLLSQMAKNGEIDLELLKFFYNSKALKKYAKENLMPYQLDKSILDI